MGSIPDPGGSAAPSFDEFQRQASLMTSCTLLWKELSDHFTSLEQDIQKKSEALRSKIQTLEAQTKTSLVNLKKREVTIEGSVEIALERLEEHKAATLRALSGEDHPDGEVDDGGEGLLRSYCVRMEAREFWRFVTARKKEIESLRKEIPAALAECVDPARFVLEAISEVFPVDKRKAADNDLGWACVLVLESLIPVVVDPVIGKSRLMVTPTIKEKAETIAEAWKKSLEERGGIENVKTPDVHTFLQHLVTFGIVKKADFVLYRKLVVGSAWRKQMPRLAVSLGLAEEMPDMIKELISRGQMLDAVHFSYEAGLQDRFPPAPLLKAFLRDAKKAAAAILEDPDNTSRAALAVRREQTALRAVIKCIEEYKLEAQFPPENLKKRVEQLEKPKPEKRKPAAVPANKRTRACNNGPMPPAKAGRLTNAYVSSFPAPPPFIRSPSHAQYPAAVPAYPSPPAIYGSRSSPSSYAYSPDAASPPMPTYPAASFSSPTYPASSFSSPTYPTASFTYPAYGGYGNGFAPAYQQAYYR